MAWQGWKPGTAKCFPGSQVNIDVDNVHGWVHYLVAPLDEQKPNENHIHLKQRIQNAKYELVKDLYLVAAVKVDDHRVINRRELIEAINRVTGLGLKFR